MKIQIHNKMKFLLGVALLVILTLIAYSSSFDNQFVNWDDQFYVTSNILITNSTWTSFKELLTRVVSLNYHPITTISLWINAFMFGVESAVPFVVTNVIFHILNSVLVLLLVFKLTQNNFFIALFTALVFAVHPMHVESVVWVSERKDVLYAFFFLLSLISYSKYLAHFQSRYLILCFVFFLFSCLSKAMAVSLVPCLFAVDYLRGRKLKNLKLIFEKIPFFLAAIFFGVIALDVQAGGDFYGFLTLSENANAIESHSLSIIDRIGNGFFSNFYYLYRFFFPGGFSPFHPYSLIENYPSWIYGLFNLVLLSSLILSFAYKQRLIAFGLTFYICTIALVLQCIPVGSAIVAERYTYLPYIGLSIVLAVLIEHLVKVKHNYLIKFGLNFFIFFLILKTYKQSSIWHNHVSLFKQAVEVYPNDAFSRKTLASGLWNNGSLDEAIYHTEFAINKLGLVTSSAFELLANCYSDKGDSNKAVSYFNTSIDIDSANVTARYHRGLELVRINPKLAIDDFDFCENTNNSYVKPLLFTPRGRAYGMLGDHKNALVNFDKAIEYFPNDEHNYLDKAITLENLFRLDEAEDIYKNILNKKPNEQFAIDRLKIIYNLKSNNYENNATTKQN